MDHNMPFGIASAHYNLVEVNDTSIDIIGACQKRLLGQLHKHSALQI